MIALVLALAHADEPPLGNLPLPSYRTRREPEPRQRTAAFRIGIPTNRAASCRAALVYDPDGAAFGELTLRGSYAWRSFGVAVETAATAGAAPGWASAGVGNTVLDVRGLFGGRVTHALGLRGIFPTGDRDEPRGPVTWWGTVPEATVPMWGGAIAYEGASERWVWHLRIGLRGRTWDFGYYANLVDASIGVATVQPLATRWDLVMEAEVMNGESPAHLRALTRRDLGGGWEADVGVAVPVVEMLSEPTVQLVGRVERRW